MDINNYKKIENEKPLDNIVTDGGFCGIFRKICCIGDSLSSGLHETVEAGVKNYFDHYEDSWGQFLARDAGCEVLNFSKGGLCARDYCNGFADEWNFFDVNRRCQAYIIALGYNDMTNILNGEMELGNVSDINVKDYSQNKPTYAGYMGIIISKYKEIQPHAKFFIMTMPISYDETPERIALCDKHAELYHEIAKLFSNCYVLDFRKYAPLYDEEFHKNFFLGGHLTNTGYRLTALMVESYIDYIIRSNPDDFRQAGFIGKHHYSAEK